MFPFFFRAGRIFGRGDFRYLVLHTLKERPMHGYEIMKVVGDRFSGFYTPSPGMVYPTLQMLEDEGYVESRNEKGKKVYQITKDGIAFLKSKKDVANIGTEKFDALIGVERMELFQELRRLSKLLFLSFEDISPDQAKKITQIVAEVRKKIADVIH